MNSRANIIRWRCLVCALAAMTSVALGADYSGTVLNPDGKPVAGATIYLVQNLGQQSPPIAHADLPTTRSDDNGQFHFHDDSSNVVEFIASADGYGLAAQNAGSSGNSIRLRPRTDLKLTFLTADNKPAANVTVALQQLNYNSLGFGAGESFNSVTIPPNYRSPFAATTDANGVCTIPGLPQGAQATLEVPDDRFAHLAYQDNVTLTAVPTTNAGPIHLLPAASISGKVTFASTRPATGIYVKAGPFAEGVTDMNGRYILKQLQTGKYTISIAFDDTMRKSWTSIAIQSFPIATGQAKTGADLQIIPGTILIGKALAADDGKPVPGVEFAIYGPANPQSGGAETDVTTGTDGSFLLCVPPGDQDISILSDSPAPGFGPPQNDEKIVTVHNGTTEYVEFRLPRVSTQTVKGKVVDLDGNPLGGATIFVCSDQRPFYNSLSFQSAADGTFQTPQIASKTRIELRAKFQDLATVKPLIVYRGAVGDAVIHLQKDALASMSGKVIDSKGKPIQGAEIDLYVRLENEGYDQTVARTDEQGNYKIESLWADPQYAIEASSDGFGETDSQLLRGIPGTTTQVPNLTLYKLDSSVAGVLLDAAENPVPNQGMYLVGQRSGYRDLTTDSQGKFQTTVATADRLTIYLNMGRQRTQQFARAGDLKIVMHAPTPRSTPAATPRAAIAAAPAPTPAPAVVATPAPESLPVAAVPAEISPADLVTWRGWLYSAALIIICGVFSILLDAIAALCGKKSS